MYGFGPYSGRAYGDNAAAGASHAASLLLETGFYLLQEDGVSTVLLEAAATATLVGRGSITAALSDDAVFSGRSQFLSNTGSFTAALLDNAVFVGRSQFLSNVGSFTAAAAANAVFTGSFVGASVLSFFGSFTAAANANANFTGRSNFLSNTGSFTAAANANAVFNGIYSGPTAGGTPVTVAALPSGAGGRHYKGGNRRRWIWTLPNGQSVTSYSRDALEEFVSQVERAEKARRDAEAVDQEPELEEAAAEEPKRKPVPASVRAAKIDFVSPIGNVTDSLKLWQAVERAKYLQEDEERAIEFILSIV